MPCVKHRMQERDQQQPLFKFTPQPDGTVTVMRLRSQPATVTIQGENYTHRWDWVGRFPSQQAAEAALAPRNTASCPECYSTNVANESGCLTCYSCGWSKCD